MAMSSCCFDFFTCERKDCELHGKYVAETDARLQTAGVIIMQDLCSIPTPCFLCSLEMF